MKRFLGARNESASSFLVPAEIRTSYIGTNNSTAFKQERNKHAVPMYQNVIRCTFFM